jgi:hypothetical protein
MSGDGPFLWKKYADGSRDASAFWGKPPAVELVERRILLLSARF